MTKADIENAAASLFITDGGEGVTCLNQVVLHQLSEGMVAHDVMGKLSLIDVVNLLCHHLEIPE